jgi:hypothetical protein
VVGVATAVAVVIGWEHGVRFFTRTTTPADKEEGGNHSNGSNTTHSNAYNRAG